MSKFTRSNIIETSYNCVHVHGYTVLSLYSFPDIEASKHILVHIQTDGRTYKHTDIRTDGRTYRRTDIQTYRRTPSKPNQEFLKVTRRKQTMCYRYKQKEEQMVVLVWNVSILLSKIVVRTLNVNLCIMMQCIRYMTDNNVGVE